MPNDYSLSELAKLAEVSTRTIRYYIAQGLLPAPVQQGPNTRYSKGALDRLKLIKRLQGTHQPLAEIRKQLAGVSDDELATLAESGSAEQSTSDSALDYIEGLLTPSRAAMPAPSEPVFMSRVAPEPPPLSNSTPSATTHVRPAEPDRAQWERITLDPDIELHIRRPLTRQHNKRVERLISIARQVLEED